MKLVTVQQVYFFDLSKAFDTVDDNILLDREKEFKRFSLFIVFKSFKTQKITMS